MVLLFSFCCCCYIYNIYVRLLFIWLIFNVRVPLSTYIYCYGLVYSEEMDIYVCGTKMYIYLTGLSTDTCVRIMCVSWLCVVFDLLIGWSYLFDVCGPHGWSLLCCLFSSSLVSFFSLYIFHIFIFIIVVVVGNFRLYVCHIFLPFCCCWIVGL